LQQEAAQALHWIELVSGGLLEKNKEKFPKEERVDAVLVSNLKAVRAELTLQLGMPVDVCHSLLARLIFTQFLFHRTDSAGRPAVSQSVLDGRFDGTLSTVYEHSNALEAILRNKEDTYALFHWLNDKFNGDMFPGKGGSFEQREAEWRAEKKHVDQKHLNLLADFVGGKIHIKSKQQFFWAQYSFDTLPLEFISSVYEEFLTADDIKLGAHYTPPHLVDFVLDAVLPWGGKEWDLKILDPCCGSSIFLVKAFQRLVQRWKNAHPGEDPRVDDLRPILENNLLGVDKSREALRVSSFSLCLALCDALDPKHYWKRTVFPPLRNIRLIERDFFSDDSAGFRTSEDAQSWDLVIGNAPWGGSALDAGAEASGWAEKNGWPVTDKNPGLVFLAKAIALTKEEGRIAMILPAGSLLYQCSSDGSNEFRRKLFTSYTVEEVVTLASLRWQLFKGVKSPACIVTLQPKKPKSPKVELNYITPKPQYSSEDDSTVVIEPQDIHRVSHEEAANDPMVWPVMLLGGRRDLRLIRQLCREMTLSKLKAKSAEKAKKGEVFLTREGIIRGSTKQRDEPQIVDRKILEKPNFPDGDAIVLPAKLLPTNKNPKVDHLHGSNDFSAFELPQLILKKTLLKSVGRFQAQLVTEASRGIICTHSYISVHQFRGGDDWLRSACLAYRSRASAYFLALTSRLASDRAEALSGDILNLPIPQPTQRVVDGLTKLDEVDSIVEEAFGLRAPESALIEDMLSFIYREGGEDREGRKPTLRAQADEDGDLHRYADFFVKSLRSTFGKDKCVRATIFEEELTHNRLPLRMVAIHLDWPAKGQGIHTEILDTRAMREKLKVISSALSTSRPEKNASDFFGIGFQRIARIFLRHKAPTGESIPTVLYLKPDQRRHWTRSQALRDADELSASIFAAKGDKLTRL